MSDRRCVKYIFTDRFRTERSKGAVGLSSDITEAIHRVIPRLLNPVAIGCQVRKAWKVKAAAFGVIDGRVTYVLDKTGTVTSIYDNLLDGAAHSKEALKALQA